MLQRTQRVFKRLGLHCSRVFVDGTDIFFQWLGRFNATVAASYQNPILLLLNNAACHGRHDALPYISHVDVCFLPKRTTAVLQPMYAGIIACVKRRYANTHAKLAVDRLDAGCFENYYDIDMQQAIGWIYELWYGIDGDIMKKC